MAERRIAEKTGRGVVCFISNYSWLDGLSFTGMRERYLEAFDAVRIDCLNGDKYKTGKTTPDGSPDPSIFSTPGDPVGIQVGTAIATLVRKPNHAPAGDVGFRHLWGQTKPEELLETAEAEPEALYGNIEPVLPLGLPFVRTAVSERWFDWPCVARSVSRVVSRGHDQPRRVPRRCRSRPSQSSRRRLLRRKPKPRGHRAALSRRDEEHSTVQRPQGARHTARTRRAK